VPGWRPAFPGCARAALGAAAALAVFLAWLNLRPAPLVIEPLRPSAGKPLVDAKLELARRFAPFVYHEFHPTLGRQDVPAPVDFDGDLDGENDWETFARFELLPTVYYAVLETETHWFLTYHLFHPRDWTRFDLGLHMTHENDGENLQIVVAKASDEPVLLFAQAHYRGVAYASPESGIGDGRERLCGPFLRVDGAGRPSERGPHACVFVESGGHGIFGVPDARSRVTVAPDGAARFELAGWVLRPSVGEETLAEPALVTGLAVPYRLESTEAKLWPLLASGELVGEGRLLDRPLPYADERIAIGVPRYYEADRFSGPFGPDRGIAPFAVDFEFGAGEVGALFFGPAARYAQVLALSGPWSLEYVDYPFVRPGGASGR
jgi:hypothetical protein